VTYIDFAALKQRVSMEQVISLLNLKVKREGSQWRSECPACKSGGPRALSMNVKDNLFRCFADGKAGGDVIGLVAHVRGTSQREAAEFLNERFPSADNSPRHTRDREEADEEAALPTLQERVDDLERRITALEENKIIHLKRRTRSGLEVGN
jgi:hypothetical protein